MNQFRLSLCLFVMTQIMTPEVDAAFNFSPPVKIDDSSGTSCKRPRMAVASSGGIIVTYYDNRYVHDNVWAVCSDDGGLTWSNPNWLLTFPSPNDQPWPEIAVSQVGSFVCWSSLTESVSRSFTFCDAWEFPGSFPSLVAYGFPDIAADDSGNVFVVAPERNDFVYFTRSGDSGDTWSSPIPISQTPITSLSKTVLHRSAAGTLYAAWDEAPGGDHDLYFTRSNDNGDTWLTPPVRIDDGPAGTDAEAVSLAQAPDGTLFAVWQDNRDGDWNIHLASSTDEGDSWTPSTRVDDHGTGDAVNPTLAVSGDGTLFAVWSNRVTESDIYISSSTDGGVSWNPSEPVEAGASGQNDFPDVALFDDSIYVTWDGTNAADGTNDIFFSSAPIPSNPLPPGAVSGLLLVKEANDVRMEVWNPAVNAVSYSVYAVVSGDKTRISEANGQGMSVFPTEIERLCTEVPIPPPPCRDANGLARLPALLFYQTVAVGSQGVEGPN